MNKIIKLLILITSVAFLNACEEIERNPLTSDPVPPQPISNPVVINKPGGAVIRYELPMETDLLYVKAKYSLKDGEKVEVRSSSYLDSVKVEGFNNTDEHKVLLYTVDRSENVSSPVEVTIQPKTPPVLSVANTIAMTEGFGGIRIDWENPYKAPLSFIILAEDSLGEFNSVETIYSSVAEGTYNLRGFDPVERIFGIVVRDRWDNFSDTLKMPLTPLYEERFDKSKMEFVILPGDNSWLDYGRQHHWLFDDSPLTIIHSGNYNSPNMPKKFTMDMGVTATLSRMVVHQHEEVAPWTYWYAYKDGNPRVFEVWGRPDAPASDGSFDGWTKLKECVAIKPSDEGGTAEEDEAHFHAGDEFVFDPSEIPSVRYLRFVIKETWGRGSNVFVAEVTLFGQVIDE